MTYCFRIRFRLTGPRIHSSDTELVLSDAAGHEVKLRPRGKGVPLAEASELVLLGGPYKSTEEADKAGIRWQGKLQKAFARVSIGADFGDRAAQGGLTEHGRRMFEAETGERVLNDVHGRMVFECEPWPRFAGIELRGFMVGRNADHVREAIDEAIGLEAAVSDRERLAYDLYSASFAEGTADARFVTLMMAVETLLDPAPRSEAAQAHVDALISATAAAGLSPEEVQSIIGALRSLRAESIGQAGRRLARTLANRTYMGETPDRFFTQCYALRSQLVHGHVPRPSRAEVNQRVAELERFAGDLLSRELLDIELT